MKGRISYDEQMLWPLVAGSVPTLKNSLKCIGKGRGHPKGTVWVEHTFYPVAITILVILCNYINKMGFSGLGWAFCFKGFRWTGLHSISNFMVVGSWALQFFASPPLCTTYELTFVNYLWLGKLQANCSWLIVGRETLYYEVLQVRKYIWNRRLE